MMHRIGLANSISRNEGNDPKEALRFALDHGFEVVQVVAGENVRKNVRDGKDLLLTDIRERGIDLICHEANDVKTEMEIYRHLLRGQEEEKVVIHHSGQNSDKIRKLTPEFIPLLENHHSGIEMDKIRNWLSDLEKFEGVEPVLDVPRFFEGARTTGEVRRRKDILANVFERITSLERPVHLHYVDRRLDAGGRTWCVLGEGIIPFREFVKEPRVETVILEYEDRENVLESREELERLLRGIWRKKP